jgi:hypothetical protein
MSSIDISLASEYPSFVLFFKNYPIKIFSLKFAVELSINVGQIRSSYLTCNSDILNEEQIGFL